MDVAPISSASYALAVSVAVGLAFSVAIGDTARGLVRDHPPFGTRFSGRISTSVAISGLLLPFLFHLPVLPPSWILASALLMGPFIWCSWRWGRTWIGRHPAHKRRQLGYQAVAAGAGGLLLSYPLALGAMNPPWSTSIPVSILFASAALPGALAYLSVMAVTAGLPNELPSGRLAGVAEVAGAGLLTNALVLGEVAQELGVAGRNWPPGVWGLMGGWAGIGFLVPGVILLARLWWRAMPDHIFMPLALAAAVVGQWLGLLLLFRYPGLVPPPSW